MIRDRLRVERRARGNVLVDRGEPRRRIDQRHSNERRAQLRENAEVMLLAALLRCAMLCPIVGDVAEGPRRDGGRA